MSEAGWKIVTHDLRPPIQGGRPLWDERAALPITIAASGLDTSDNECGEGLNFTATLAEAVAITGLFRGDRQVRAFAVEAPPDRLVRATKRRAPTLTLTREATAADWQRAFTDLSARWFPDHAERMAQEQSLWWAALARPHHDEQAVSPALTAALTARSLPWTLRHFDTAWDAWDAWDAWAARAAWDARDAWDAWDAWAAICTTYAALRGWIAASPERHTTGIRDAYAHGLGIAIPTGPNELGYAMQERA